MSILPVDHETIDRLIEAAVPAPAVDQQRPTLADKVELLSRPGAYPGYQGEVARRETHMSWVFLTRDRAYKLKKPVRFPYLDFSTLALREAACRAEIRLNRRLAPDVYLGVVPLTCVRNGALRRGRRRHRRLARRHASPRRMHRCWIGRSQNAA